MTQRVLITLLLLSGLVAAQERVSMRRLADTVAIRRGPERLETVLYYFAASADMGAGDELEQGSSGHSEIYLDSGGLVELHMQAHAIIMQLSPEGDVIRFPWLTLGQMTGGERPLICELPGGVTCRLQQTEMEVRVDEGRMRIRNRGGQPVEVRGVISIERGSEGTGMLVLGQGEEAYLPLVRYIPEPPGRLQDSWSDLSLRHDGGFALDMSGEELVVSAADDPEAPQDDVLTVGGVRTLVDGERLLISNHRRPAQDPLSVQDILGRVSGSSEISPEAVQELLRRYSPEQLRQAGAEINAEQEAEGRRQRGEGGGSRP